MVRLRLPAWALTGSLLWLCGCCCNESGPCGISGFPGDPCCRGCMGSGPTYFEGPVLGSGAPMMAPTNPGCGCDRGGAAPIPAPRMQPYVQPMPPEGAMPPLAPTAPPQAQPTPFTPNGNGNGNGIR